MREETLIILALILASLILVSMVKAAPQFKEYALNYTDGWIGDVLGIGANITGNITHPMNATWLATNETGTWLNYSTPATRISLGDNASTYTMVNLTMSNSTACGRPYGVRMYMNDTAGEENVTPIEVFTVHPALNGSSVPFTNFTAFECEDRHNMTFIRQIGPDSWVEGLFNYTVFDGSMECSYNATGAEQIEIKNITSYCWVNLTFSAATSSHSVKVYKFEGLKFKAPPNLPAAISSAAVAVVIVIYAVVRKRSSGSWT